MKTAKIVGAAQPVSMVAAGVILTVGGVEYRAETSGAAKPNTWLAGPLVNETSFDIPLKDAAGKPHPRLTVRIGVRCFGNQARVETVIENTKTFTVASNETYDVEIQVGGRTTYTAKGLTHYHHARWRRVDWVNGQPELLVHLDAAYLIATRAVSNYDQSVRISTFLRAGASNEFVSKPLTYGLTNAYEEGK